MSATRWYSFAGKLVAHRTGNGLSGVSSVVTDPQGSVVGTVHNTDWASGVVRKRPDPFGGARSSTSVTSAGRGFLGAVHDSNALVLLGARYFDPAAGVFVSVDPLLDPGNPAQFNAYVYAGNNPVTWSDPSGLAWTGPVADGGDHRYVAKDKNATGKPKTKQGTGSTRSSGTTSTVISGVTITSHTAFGACGQSYNPCASRPWTAEERKFMSSAIQGTLTVIGAVPVVGEFADGLAALICLGEGDMACAGLSVASMVPIVGWGAAVAKGVKIGDNIIDAARTTAKAAPESLVFGTRAAARAGLPGDLAAVGNRFFRGATSKSRDFKATGLEGGGYRLEYFSPANNPGYGKLYVQEIDSAGDVIREFKNTMGPAGLIETKWVHGEP